MSEFEMAYLHNDMMIALGTAIQYHFTLLTAFLVASYLAAHRLTRLMAGIVVGGFVVASVGSIVTIYRILDSLAGLNHEIKAFVAAGKGLAWHAIARTPVSAIDTSRFFAVALFLAAAIAAVAFFFHARRANRKAEAGSWKPKV